MSHLIKGPDLAQDTRRPSSQLAGDLFAPEGQRHGIGDKGKRRKGAGERRKRYLPWRDKGVVIDKRQFIKKRGNPMLG